MTRLEIAQQELANLEIQLSDIEKNFGRGLAPVELEQRILDLRNQVKQLKAEENRKDLFVSFCENICLVAGLHKVSEGSFRKKELYNAEISINYDDDDDMFRVIVVTVSDYTVGEIAIRYQRVHADQTVTEDARRVVFKITEDSFAFSSDGYDQILEFIRVNADESVRYLREAELIWTVRRLRSAFAKQGLVEKAWTPAESELNI